MRFLVTGAGGYLGRGVVTELLNRGADIIAADYKLEGVDEKANKIEGNIFDIEDPYNYFGEPDVLIHLAWRDGFVHYSDAHINDLPLHYGFLKKIASSDIKKISVMGSVHEVGFFEGSVNEGTACRPVTPYGISKNALRQLIEAECNKQSKKFQWMRGYYIIGNQPYGSSVFAKIVSAVDKGEEKFPFTMGLNQFDFLDYDKFCSYVAETVMQDDVCGIINICSGRPEKLADRAERFISENEFPIKLEYGAFPDRPYDSKAIWGDDSKISKILEGRRV